MKPGQATRVSISILAKNVMTTGDQVIDLISDLKDGTFNSATYQYAGTLVQY